MAFVLVNLPPVQTYLAHFASNILSKKIKSKVSVEKLQFSLLNRISLKGVYLEDQNKDTLLYAGSLQIRITDWFLSKKNPELHYLGLKNTFIHLYRTPEADVWNYTFLADAFASNSKDTSTSKPFEFNLNQLVLENVRFHMDDKWVGWDTDYDVGSLELDAKKLDIDKRNLDINELTIKGAYVYLKDYKGGRPKRDSIPLVAYVFDATPFNPAKWTLETKKLDLIDCRFGMDMGDKSPLTNEFDYNHLDITKIQAKISTVKIIGDTIYGNLEHFEVHERCGLEIKSMKSKITVSPIASICDNLYLETNHSKIKNYYAMHYKHFPDFVNYIDSVTMVGRLRDATIDKRDIAFFAPVMRTFPQVVLKANGDGKGTVSNLVAHHLDITDGSTILKGNGSIVGLPDINKSKIEFNNGEIATTNAGILKYVPGLKTNTDIAFDQLSYAYFIGSYSGYIDDFSVNGSFLTNLGKITTAINLKIPNFNPDSATYKGNITTDNLQVGKFLNQEDILGGLSINENISGFSFNPNLAQVDIDGSVSGLFIKGYNYHNITTKGQLAKRQFDGSLMIDDPNFSLEFDGGIDYTGTKAIVKAKAHLLSSNFKTLNWTESLFTASADFDLNCTGSNIDNFSGFAHLDNIDIKRDNHKLDLDSVYLNATGDSTNKTLTIQSNALYAKIKGNYQLSKLPTSFQYYLSNYIPSYVKKPKIIAPDQNLEFTINTTDIDSLLAITLPGTRGFDTSYLSGMLNTNDKTLSLVANIPYGAIGKVRMSNVAISCLGTLNTLSINTTVDNVAIGDSGINGSLGLTATLGNDSLDFTIATTAPDTSSTIVLNGQVLAKQDSLFLTMKPSEFYLGLTKWDIDKGAKAVYADGFLLVDNLKITSGFQRITANYQQQGPDQLITVNTEHIDLGLLGNWVGMGQYQPEGRLDGTIQLKNIIRHLYVSTFLKATNLQFGVDTIGTVNIIGDYDQWKKLAIIDPQSGVYYNNSSIAVSGKISFDSNTNQQLDGLIQFVNTPLSNAAPFVAGIFSQMVGTLNGKINIGGKSYAPEIDGSVMLKNGGFKLDYMGCNYKIPTAEIHINNERISWGIMKIEDLNKNTGEVTGYFSHNLFKDMKMHINVHSHKLDIMKIAKADNTYFYGNVTAGMDSFTITGPFNDIYLNAFNVYPTGKSHIYIPLASTGDVGTYSYISFKTYGSTTTKPKKKTGVKINVNIDANLNDLADITILLDPVSGDAIDAKGDGNIQLKMPANNDMRITGGYNIESGTYTFTFKQLEFKKQFKLNSGSTIYFKGPFSATTVDVFATYSAKARLFDLMTTTEQAAMQSTGTDYIDAKRVQPINIVLHMQDALFNPKLSFDLNVDDKSMESNPAYTKLQLINQDERQKLDQVASLLLTGSFLSSDGLFSNNSVKSGALNNVSQMLSGTASASLTSVVNKLIGERKVNIDVNYQNYNYSDAGNTSLNRNQFTGTISKNYLNDRLVIEVGGKSNWGQQATSSSAGSSYNISGDFKMQYLISPSGKLRLNCFSTSDYDVTLERQITRNGVGISWRKTFDNMDEFLHAQAKTAPVPKVIPNLNNDTLAPNTNKSH